MDESNLTCDRRRRRRRGSTQSEPARRAYREMIVITPGLGESISGAILYDETIRQHTSEGIPSLTPSPTPGSSRASRSTPARPTWPANPGEQVTEGLDGLHDRLVDYQLMGARFAKWRAVFTIGAGPQPRVYRRQRRRLGPHDPQTQHGPPWLDLRDPGRCGRCGRDHCQVPAAEGAASVPGIAFLSGGQPALRRPRPASTPSTSGSLRLRHGRWRSPLPGPSSTRPWRSGPATT
jgi:hypothetical protein